MVIVTEDAIVEEVLEGEITHLIVEAELPGKAPKFPLNYSISTRSRLAQVGIDICGVQGYGAKIKDNIISEYAAVLNYKNLDFEFKEGDAVCRFFNTFSGYCIAEKLDLDFILKENNYKVNEAGIIELKPQPCKFHLAKEPKNLSDLNNLNDILEKEEVEKLSINPFEFALVETNPVEIPGNCCGILHTMTSGSNVPYHLSSPFIDPGFKGPIRLEFYNSSVEKIEKPRVYFSLLRHNS